MQGIEDDIGGQLGQSARQIAAGIDLDHVPISCIPECRGAFLA